jgi:hypothetical protein
MKLAGNQIARIRGLIINYCWVNRTIMDGPIIIPVKG